MNGHLKVENILRLPDKLERISYPDAKHSFSSHLMIAASFPFSIFNDIMVNIFHLIIFSSLHFVEGLLNHS